MNQENGNLQVSVQEQEQSYTAALNSFEAKDINELMF